MSSITTWVVLPPFCAAIAIAEHAFPTSRAARTLLILTVGVVINTLCLIHAPLVRREAGRRRR